MNNVFETKVTNSVSFIGLHIKKYCYVKLIFIHQQAYNTELTIHALDQVHCWDAYFRLRIGHYENFTPLNFQPLLFSKQ
jgi:hypothetical protein